MTSTHADKHNEESRSNIIVTLNSEGIHGKPGHDVSTAAANLDPNFTLCNQNLVSKDLSEDTMTDYNPVDSMFQSKVKIAKGMRSLTPRDHDELNNNSDSALHDSKFYRDSDEKAKQLNNIELPCVESS